MTRKKAIHAPVKRSKSKSNEVRVFEGPLIETRMKLEEIADSSSVTLEFQTPIGDEEIAKSLSPYQDKEVYLQTQSNSYLHGSISSISSVAPAFGFTYKDSPKFEEIRKLLEVKKVYVVREK